MNIVLDQISPWEPNRALAVWFMYHLLAIVSQFACFTLFQLSINASIHPNGVLYNKSQEGSLYDDGTNKKSDDIVPPGGTYVYEWTIPDSMAPTMQDTPCIAWLYSSSVNPIKDAYSGKYDNRKVAGEPGNSSHFKEFIAPKGLHEVEGFKFQS